MKHVFTKYLMENFHPAYNRNTIQIFICIDYIFENNLRIKHVFTKYLKGSFYFTSDFSFKDFSKYTFIIEIKGLSLAVNYMYMYVQTTNIVHL